MSAGRARAAVKCPALALRATSAMVWWHMVWHQPRSPGPSIPLQLNGVPTMAHEQAGHPLLKFDKGQFINRDALALFFAHCLDHAVINRPHLG